MKTQSLSRRIKERLRDHVASLIASLPTPLQKLLIRGFRRPILWSVLSLLSEFGYSAHIFEIRMPEALCVATPVSVTAMASQGTGKS